MTEQQRICRTLESYGFQLDRTAKARGRKVYRHPETSVYVAFIVGRSLRHFTSTYKAKLFERSMPTARIVRQALIKGALTDDMKRRLGLPIA